MRTRQVSGDSAVPLFEARPEGTGRGGVVVIQEAFGLTDHIKNVAGRLAAQGWLAVAPALFHRLGSPVFDYQDMDAARPAMAELTAAGIEADLDAAFAHLADEGFTGTRTGIVGFCMGGTVAFVAGVHRRLGAAVTYYGSGITNGRFGFAPLVKLAPSLATPWLGLYGDQDGGIPVEEVEALREAASGARVETELVRYPRAGHAFNRDGWPPYHEESATDAWRRTLAWFDRHLK